MLSMSTVEFDVITRDIIAAKIAGADGVFLSLDHSTDVASFFEYSPLMSKMQLYLVD